MQLDPFNGGGDPQSVPGQPSITWELVRNGNSDLLSQKVRGQGPAICVLTTPGDSEQEPLAEGKKSAVVESYTIGSQMQLHIRITWGGLETMSHCQRF